MIQGLRKAAVACTLVGLALALSGCEMVSFVIRIPDFDSKQVEGVWLWRADAADGTYQRDGLVVLSEPFVEAGIEQVTYVQRTPAGEDVFDLRAQVLRNPLDPDAVTLRIYYARQSEPGYFRASSFNAVGESPMTAEVTIL